MGFENGGQTVKNWFYERLNNFAKAFIWGLGFSLALKVMGIKVIAAYVGGN